MPLPQPPSVQRSADLVAVDEYNLPYGATLLASAARTASPTDVLFAVPHRTTGLILVVNTTAAGVSPSTTVTIEGVTKQGAVYTILAGVAITAVGVQVLQVGRGLPATANASANATVPEHVILHVVHGNATTHTYSVEVIATP